MKAKRTPIYEKILSTLLDLSIIFLPLAILFSISYRLGINTPIGGLFANLAYGISVINAWMVMKMRGFGWREIGLAKPDSWPHTALLGIAVLVGIVFVSTLLQFVLLNLPGLTLAPPDQSRFNPLSGNLPLLLASLVFAWTTIAIGEKVVWRAFLTDRFVNLLPITKYRWVFALIGSSIGFGLIHSYSGPLGVIETAVMGFVFGVVYLRSGRNLCVTIIAHGMANSLRFIQLFLGAGS